MKNYCVHIRFLGCSFDSLTKYVLCSHVTFALEIMPVKKAAFTYTTITWVLMLTHNNYFYYNQNTKASAVPTLSFLCSSA